MTHYLLQQRHESWASLESQIENLPSAQEKGEVFEQFVFSYLIINKDYYQDNHEDAYLMVKVVKGE